MSGPIPIGGCSAAKGRADTLEGLCDSGPIESSVDSKPFGTRCCREGEDGNMDSRRFEAKPGAREGASAPCDAKPAVLWKSDLIAVLLLVGVAAFAAFANTWYNGFAYDDVTTLGRFFPQSHDAHYCECLRFLYPYKSGTTVLRPAVAS